MYTITDRYLKYKDYRDLIHTILDDIGKPYVSSRNLHMSYLVAERSIKIHSLQKLPFRIVTLNSEVVLTSDHSQKQLFKIVLPHKINGNNDVSIYSSIGIACLGRKEKDYVYIQHKDYPQRLQIEKIIYESKMKNTYSG